MDYQQINKSTNQQINKSTNHSFSVSFFFRRNSVRPAGFGFVSAGISGALGVLSWMASFAAFRSFRRVNWRRTKLMATGGSDPRAVVAFEHLTDLFAQGKFFFHQNHKLLAGALYTVVHLGLYDV
jgi:hypothetical protein